MQCNVVLCRTASHKTTHSVWVISYAYFPIFSQYNIQKQITIFLLTLCRFFLLHFCIVLLRLVFRKTGCSSLLSINWAFNILFRICCFCTLIAIDDVDHKRVAGKNAEADASIVLAFLGVSGIQYSYSNHWVYFKIKSIIPKINKSK